MRLLVAEDDARLRGILERGLTDAAYAVDAVPDGEQALRMAAFNDYDAIVLDVMLPGKDGFEVCRTLRGRGVRTPVLMLTARDAVDDRIARTGRGRGRLPHQAVRLRRAGSRGCGRSSGGRRSSCRRRSGWATWRWTPAARAPRAAASRWG